MSGAGKDALLAHARRGLTTLCTAWAIRRRDGVTLAFTDHDQPLDFDGLAFRADSGLSARALAQSTGLSVDNTEALGALSDDAIREDEIEQGRFDGAEVCCWRVNWADVTARCMIFRGTIGEMQRAGGAFRAELRGLTEALRGQISRGSTATESAIADAGTQVRVAGLKRAYRQAVNQVFRSAAWFYFYGEDMIAPIGKEGERYDINEFRGGVEPGSGREEWNFFDLSLKIDAFSMEHTDQAILQKRTQDMMQVMVQASGVMPERPWVNWREPMRHMFEVINIGDADEWFNWEVLEQTQQAMMGGQPGGMPAGQMPGQDQLPPVQSPPGALPNPGTVAEQPYQRVMRGAMQGNIAGEASNLA